MFTAHHHSIAVQSAAIDMTDMSIRLSVCQSVCLSLSVCLSVCVCQSVRAGILYQSDAR